MDPADVTQSPSSRMTPRHDLDAAIALVRSESDQFGFFDESAAMSVP
jgi:hypothetical protein